MKLINGKTFYSASDVTNLLACPHLTNLDRLNLDSPQPKAETDEQVKLIQDKGLKHEKQYLENLIKSGKTVVDCSLKSKSDCERAEHTKQQIRAGVEVVYQAFFLDEQFLGYSDFLVRVPQKTILGEFGYEVDDTKLSKTEKTSFIIQLCFYSELLSKIQGEMPKYIHVVLGNKERHSFPINDYFAYFKEAKQQFLDAVTKPAEEQSQTYPRPCNHCPMCHWRDCCKAQLVADDNLSLVATIRKKDIERLESAGISTLAALATLPNLPQIPKVNAARISRLHAQAKLQYEFRNTQKPVYGLFAPSKAGLGFEMLPEANAGDLFYDIEGDPLIEEAVLKDEFADLRGGLEYLHGVCYLPANSSTPVYKSFWAFSKGSEEKRCFEELMDFFSAHFQKHPNAKIYHYASYEISALKRLMCEYGTREHALDQLLRGKVFIDLYKVVKNGLLISEPKYSIKNLEIFYMQKRQQELKSGGASVVWFEKFLETKDEELKKKLKDDIELYNKVDCESTYLLRNWLLKLQKESFAIFPPHQEVSVELLPATASEDVETKPESVAVEADRLLATYQAKLCYDLPESRNDYSEFDQFRESIYFLLDYFRREDKPKFWEMFARAEKTDSELIDDSECLASLTLDDSIAPQKIKRSFGFSYRFPPQETKLRAGSSAKCIIQNKVREIIELDITKGTAIIKYSAGTEPPQQTSLIPTPPLSTQLLKDAVFRFAETVVSELANIKAKLPISRFRAVVALLKKEPPQFSGRTATNPLISYNSSDVEFLPELNSLVRDLDGSTLIIQGPPGTGKTYAASHLIFELLKQGKRVGVTSHSHKAIDNLLTAVDSLTTKNGFSFNGIKKTSESPDLENPLWQNIKEEPKADKIAESGANLIAGTAWLFSRAEFDQTLDYLFIEEAGQVALAMAVAMGLSAKNLILLGDPMQLPHPSQGTHPGESGSSVLEYLQGESATVATDRGVLLNTTFRLHSKISSFISTQVYEGRLRSAPDTDLQSVISPKGEFPANGIIFIPVEHQGNSRTSIEEVEKIKLIYHDLLASSLTDRSGQKRPFSQEDILVIAPYNAQVNLLKHHLGSKAKVGTIDKFQGQEAQVSILSMATSSDDELPRDIDFLFSRNRMNVALSRAMAIAIVVACPDLLRVRCKTVEQVKLVNMLCSVARISN